MTSKHRETDPSTEVAVPIVPMLDLSFQLLFFFVATFNPNKAEGKMTLNLPASGQAKAKDLANVDPSKISDTELEIPADFVVVLRAYDDSFSLSIRDAEKVIDVGAARGLTPQNRKEEIEKLLKSLEEKLTAKYTEKKEKDGDKATNNVKIEPNSKTKYADLVAVMDTCIRSGYVQVGFAPPPDMQQ